MSSSFLIKYGSDLRQEKADRAVTLLFGWMWKEEKWCTARRALGDCDRIGEWCQTCVEDERRVERESRRVKPILQESTPPADLFDTANFMTEVDR